ncbi:MAG: DUF1284 domain-containing protein [Cyanobacteria bacterium REEB65]|nr:DUF1284 domain-containing protein [Cyanobacteria bacterium REEB65]
MKHDPPGPPPSRPVVDSLRAHHFLCLTTYAGKGYSPKFVANLNEVWQAARDKTIGRLHATVEADPVCLACPHLQDLDDRESCTFHASIARRDRRMLEAMGWQENLAVDFAAAMDEVHTRHRQLMDRVCGGCDWVPICRQERFTLRDPSFQLPVIMASEIGKENQPPGP